MGARTAFAISALVFSSYASAAVVSGDIIIIAPPADASPMALESSDHAFFWDEGITTTTQSLFNEVTHDEANPNNHPGSIVTLLPGQGTGFTTEIDGDFFYDSGNAGVQGDWGGDLAAGTYHSYFFHADKQGANETFEGSITLDQEIVGIIFKQTELCETDDVFGVGGTIYADCGSSRRLELEPLGDNWLRISADLKTVEFSTNLAHDMDDMRILTTAVPVPAAVWLFGSGLGLLGWIRRRSIKA